MAYRFDCLARVPHAEGAPTEIIERALLGVAIGRRARSAGTGPGLIDIPAMLRRMAADLEELRTAGRA